MHRFNINIYIYMWVMTECFNTRILRGNSVYSALEVLHAHTRNNKKLFRMHLPSKPFEFIAFGLMLTNDMITLTKCRNRRVWYGLGQTNWIQMEMCIDFYLHSNHRQLVEPIYASFVPFLLFLLLLSLFLFDDEKGSHQNRFVLVGKKSDDFVFSSFLYLRAVQLQSNKYIVTQRLRRSNAAGCMHRVNQTEVTTILGKKKRKKATKNEVKGTKKKL